MKFKKALIIFLVSVMPTVSFAGALWQDSVKPEVGKPCPEFTLTYVKHYTKREVTLTTFKGQWLFLDFWFTGCTSCIQSLPKINKLQNEFKGKVQFLMVGMNDHKYNRNIESVFEKLRKKQGLNLAVAYDSTLGPRWQIYSMPHIVVIDPKGIVRYITSGNDLTMEKISDLLEGKPVTLSDKEIKRPDFDDNLVNKSQDKFPREKIVCQSLLTRWNGEAQNGGYAVGSFATFPVTELQKGFQFAMVNLHWLYNTAYLGQYYFKFLGDSLYGKVYHFPVLELKDSSLFEYSYGVELGKGLYSYSLLVPPERMTKEGIMKYMQQDLERTFGFNASVEERDMPVWALVAKPDAGKKIKTKGGQSYNSASVESSVAGFTVRNTPVKDFFMSLVFYLAETERHPFINSTGIEGNIDLTIDADLTNIHDVKRELQKNGLDLVLSTKRMKVLVIRDKK